jgi:hypothetical protein
LENFEHVVLGSSRYGDTAEFCAKLKDLQEKMVNPDIGISHGILCTSNIPPTGAPTAMASVMWRQFDETIGYGTITRDQRKQVFDWFFKMFAHKCNTHKSLQNVTFDLDENDLNYLLDSSVQATPEHIKKFCQKLFRGVIYDTAETPKVVVNREFINHGGPNHGFLSKIGSTGITGHGGEDDDDDDDGDDNYCIVHEDLVGIQDAYDIAAGRGPYMGQQPTVTIGRQQKEKIIKKQLEEEDRIKREEEKKLQRAKRELVEDDESTRPIKGEKKIPAFGSVFKKQKTRF